MSLTYKIALLLTTFSYPLCPGVQSVLRTLKNRHDPGPHGGVLEAIITSFTRYTFLLSLIHLFKIQFYSLISECIDTSSPSK